MHTKNKFDESMPQQKQNWLEKENTNKIGYYPAAIAKKSRCKHVHKSLSLG